MLVVLHTAVCYSSHVSYDIATNIVDSLPGILGNGGGRQWLVH